MEHSTMTQKDAYDYGFNNGYGIGECNISDYSDFDTFISECLETESDYFRQFSPFEFYANEFNATAREVHYTRTDSAGRTNNHTRIVKQYPDAMWESYDNGVYKGLLKSWKDLH